MKVKQLDRGRVEVEWDYIPNSSIYFNNQKDWNNTLITKINQISAHRFQYYNKKNIPKPDLPLVVPIKFRKLITEHEYYNEKTKLLAGRYKILFIQNSDDYIEFDGNKVRIINFKSIKKMENKSENTNMVIDTIIERQDEEQKKKNYKLLIIGHMRHGKDTVAEMIEKFTGMSFKSSSEMAAEIFIYDELKGKYGYTSFMECYVDRMNHRAEWHDLICDYNIPDKARLAKEILIHNDMYVGMRSQDEIQKCIDDNVFDMIIGVYDERKSLEPKDSFNIDLWKSSDVIIPNNSTLEDLSTKVKKICKYLLS